MIGAMIGDIVGSRFEFNNHRSTEFEFFTKECFVTDDSIMTLAVAKAILETERELVGGLPFDGRSQSRYLDSLSANTIKFMQEIGQNYPDCGYGSNFGRWIFSKHPRPYGSFGNGAAMRVSPVVEVAKTLEEVKLLSEAVTKITHNHPEGIKGAEATATAIFLAKTGHKKEKIKEYIEAHYYVLDFTLDEIRDSYLFNETCQMTVPQAIEAFLESDSFEDAIRKAISVGGDSDTLAAITGSIAQAYYEVPQELEAKALTYLDQELLAIYQEWRNQ